MGVGGALIAVGGGTVVNFLAQASTGDGGGQLGPYISAGGTMTAVGGIVYIAKLLATGKLVARDPAVEAEALKKLAEANATIALEGQERERQFLRFLTDGHAADRRHPEGE